MLCRQHGALHRGSHIVGLQAADRRIGGAAFRGHAFAQQRWRVGRGLRQGSRAATSRQGQFPALLGAQAHLHGRSNHRLDDVEKIGWTKAEDGQLARDLNNNGKIDDITELFGDDITSAFYKLAMLDSNKDRVIDKNDKAFYELVVWQDLNSNGYSEKEELKNLEKLKL